MGFLCRSYFFAAMHRSHAVYFRSVVESKESDHMRSTAMFVTGIVLIAAGTLLVAFRGIPYTSREVILKVGALNATAETEKTKQVPPIVTGSIIAGGILLVIVGARRSHG
jgi:hypothetical protein